MLGSDPKLFYSAVDINLSLTIDKIVKTLISNSASASSREICLLSVNGSANLRKAVTILEFSVRIVLISLYSMQLG